MLMRHAPIAAVLAVMVGEKRQEHDRFERNVFEDFERGIQSVDDL